MRSSVRQSATEFVMQRLGFEPHHGAVWVCGLCGAAAPAREARNVLKSGFTNWDELCSEHVCWACAAALDDRRTRSSLVVDRNGHRKLERREIWPLLLDPPEPPWVSFFSVSGKKHGLFRQSVATSRTRFQVQVEDLSCRFDRDRDREWMRVASELILAGARRTSVLSGSYDHGDFHRVGYARIHDAEQILINARCRRMTWATITSVMPGRKDLESMSW